MFATVDKQRLYLTTWMCNALRVFGILAGIVEEAGGRVKPARTAVISNRTLDRELYECSERLERLKSLEKTWGPNAARDSEIASLRDRIRRLSSIDNAEAEVYGQSWISFVLGDKKYYASVDDNPFFDYMYIKTPLRADGTYSADASADTLDRSWAADCLFYYGCTEDSRRDAAQKLFDILRAADNTPIIRGHKRVRVQNQYDGGYHYETVYAKPRVSRIDF